MPVPVEAIQVDGGSELKAEFEQACQAKASTSCRPNGHRSMAPSILDNFQHLYDHPQAPRRPRRTNPGRLPQSAPSNRCPRHLICADPADPGPALVVFPRKAYYPTRKVASW
jgi:hypothetical protein